MLKRKNYFIISSFIIPVLFAASFLSSQIDSNAVGNERVEYSFSVAGEVFWV